MASPSHLRADLTRERAFTLVEVMISIALALILILGISQIFGIAQRTTGAGTAVLASSQSNRTIQAALGSDIQTMTNGTDSPGLVIVSYSVPAFRNAQDKLQNRGFTGGVADPLKFNDPNSNGSLATNLPFAQATAVNSRVHRLDRLCFFGRDYFTRQTGDDSSNPASLTSPVSSREAFIWLGHVSLPNNPAIAGWRSNQPGNPTAGQFFAPGGANIGTQINDNNIYASSFILGREIILLIPKQITPGAAPSTLTTERTIVARTATTTVPQPADSNPLSILPTPLGTGPALAARLRWNNPTGTVNNVAVLNPRIPLSDSRYDTALTDLATYRRMISPTTVLAATWWSDLTGFAVNPAGVVVDDVRYKANPFVVKPATTGAGAMSWMSAAAAQTYPIFLNGCTQFIIEFAGDYVTQNPANGAVMSAGSDGDIDYVVESGTTPGNQIRHIRWYGFPRDTNDDGKIDSTHDVVPARDIAGAALPFERALPSGSAQPDYAQSNTVLFTNASAPKIPSKMSHPYVCAWGPDTDALNIPRPKMIRITLAIDDPQGHLNTEQTYSYVFNLP